MALTVADMEKAEAIERAIAEREAAEKAKWEEWAGSDPRRRNMYEFMFGMAPDSPQNR